MQNFAQLGAPLVASVQSGLKDSRQYKVARRSRQAYKDYLAGQGAAYQGLILKSSARRAYRPQSFLITVQIPQASLDWLGLLITATQVRHDLPELWMGAADTPGSATACKKASCSFTSRKRGYKSLTIQTKRTSKLEVGITTLAYLQAAVRVVLLPAFANRDSYRTFKKATLACAR